MLLFSSSSIFFCRFNSLFNKKASAFFSLSLLPFSCLLVFPFSCTIKEYVSLLRKLWSPILGEKAKMRTNDDSENRAKLCRCSHAKDLYWRGWTIFWGLRERDLHKLLLSCAFQGKMVGKEAQSLYGDAQRLCCPIWRSSVLLPLQRNAT